MVLMDTSPAIDALVRFTFGNLGSFRDDASLTLGATRVSDAGVARQVPWRADGGTVAVLAAAGVFGANASGKTAVLRALADMRLLVLGSFRSGSATTRLHRRPFLLDAAATALPSHFEVDLALGGVRWQYGFEITDAEVVSEWAYRFPKGRQALVFERDGTDFDFAPSMRGAGRQLQRLSRHNSLLLSVAGAAADPTLGPLFGWFADNLVLAEAYTRGLRAARTAELADSPKRGRVLELLQAADLGITDIRRESADPEFVERLHRAVRILMGQEGDLDSSEAEQFVVEDFVRLTHCGPEHCVELDPRDESQGTLVWVGLIGPIIDALDRGAVLLVDELSSSLHPALVERLVRLFQDPVTNPRVGQLIFNDHNTVLLGDSADRVLGRDQIWFTEKGNDGASRLYSLADFSPRHDDAVGRRYLQGRYGGLPVLDPSGFERAALGNEEPALSPA